MLDIAFDEICRNFACMKLHVFNPEHDTALASNKAPFTPPHAARQLHHDLGFVSAVWAEEGDYVVVDDKDSAKESLKRIGYEGLNCILVEPKDLAKIDAAQLDEVCVWGWDKAIKRRLVDLGLVCNDIMPTSDMLNQWRIYSGRAWAAEHILKPLTHGNSNFVGSSVIVSSVEEAVNPCDLEEWVLKSPWSCSGRGVRYVLRNSITSQLQGWVANTIKQQGYIMVEPFYTKILDLAAEFYSDGKGRVCFLGLSLFETKNGAYTGNIIAPENRKREVISNYISLNVLDEAIANIVSLTTKQIGCTYRGHFGIDMMVVADKDWGFSLHPCVELNLRRTMGYMALCFNTADDIPTKVMRISMDKKYRLRISESEDDIWK